MEKLIELLNECDKSQLNEFEDYVERRYCKWNGKILKGNWENNNELTPYELCSKQYGFIKRLVDNDKIEREKFGNSKTKSSKYSDYELSYDTPREDYTNILLMELAIQDEPINFLISILK